jgi:hypothetical protein
VTSTFPCIRRTNLQLSGSKTINIETDSKSNQSKKAEAGCSKNNGILQTKPPVPKTPAGAVHRHRYASQEKDGSNDSKG